MTTLTLEGHRGGTIHPEATVVYIAIGAGSRDLAACYSEGRGDAVLAVTYEARNPLMLDTPAKVRQAWEASRGLECEGPFYHPTAECSQRLLNEWASAHGHDAIVVTESAFEGEDGYEWAGGTFGEPQAALLEPRRVEVHS